MSKTKELCKLMFKIRADESLKYDSSNKYVIQRGSDDPKIVFVGEAPGRDEDEQGLPFVGKAGRLLDEWIRQAEIDIPYTILNIVKCRPPNNRKPTEEEIKKHAVYTEEQLKILNPDLIILVGATATKYFHPYIKSFLKEVGSVITTVNRDHHYIIPHPAYVLRNPSYNITEVIEGLKAAIELTVAK